MIVNEGKYLMVISKLIQYLLCYSVLSLLQLSAAFHFLVQSPVMLQDFGNKKSCCETLYQLKWNSMDAFFPPN